MSGNSWMSAALAMATPSSPMKWKRRQTRDAALMMAGGVMAISLLEYKYSLLSNSFSLVYERLCTRIRVQATNRAILPYGMRGGGGGGGGRGGEDDESDDMLRSDDEVVYNSKGNSGNIDKFALHVDGNGNEIDLTIDSNENNDSESEMSSGHTSESSANNDSFFASTKFFACLGIEECRELFLETETVHLADGDCLFTQGDASEDGIYIVLEGQLGVFIPDNDREVLKANDNNSVPYLNSSSMNHLRSQYIPGLRGKVSKNIH